MNPLAPYVERIAEAAQGIQAAKAAIASAITAKGGTVASADGLEDFPAAIAAIPSGGGAQTVTGTFTITTLGGMNIVHNAGISGDYLFAFVMQAESVAEMREATLTKNYTYMGCVICSDKFPTIEPHTGFHKSLSGSAVSFTKLNALGTSIVEGTTYTANRVSNSSVGLHLGTYDWWAIPITVN